jgi:ribonuclease-3
MRETQSNLSGSIAKLEVALGHKFERPSLLVRALTHRSQAYELAMESGGPVESEMDLNPQSKWTKDHSRGDNERLEFLGDAVLGMIVAEALFQSNPEWQEGELTRMRANLVSRRHMAEVALAINLGDYLLLGKGEERSGGRKKAAILANAMEAVLAAMYIDAASGRPDRMEGGLGPVRRFTQKYILGSAADDLARELKSGAALGDHKSALQQLLQATHASVPVYLVESESGPDHRKRFSVSLYLRNAAGDLGEALTSGTGSTKKKAEQEAARRGLILLAEQQAEQNTVSV